MTSPVNVDVKLGVNKFNVDEEHPHIVVKADADKQALELLVKACPAGLYKKQDDGSVRFDYAGCLAVSYTHLDVYKRQVRPREMRARKILIWMA